VTTPEPSLSPYSSSSPSASISSAPSNHPSLTVGPTVNITESNNPLPLSWLISEATEPLLLTTNEDDYVLAIQYNASNREYGVKVFEKDCKTDSSVPLLDFSDSRSSTTGFINIHVNLTLVPADIEVSNIWEPSTSSEAGSISFCLSTFLLSAEKKVVQESIIFNLAIDNILEFNIGGINTFLPNQPVNNDFNITYGGKVDAYECDPDTMDQLSNPSNHGPYDILHICVEETSNDDVVITSFFSLTVNQVGGYLSFDAIVNGEVQPEYEELAIQKCMNGKCMVSVQLLNEFFVNDEVKELQVVGSVIVKFEQNSDSFRVYKEAGEEADGSFSMFVELDRSSCDGKGKLLTSLLTRLHTP